MDQTIPMINSKYPDPKYRIGKAWRDLWLILQASSEPQEGRTIVADVASTYDLAPATLTNLLSRAANAGLLRSELRPVKGKVTRNHAFYAIAK